MATQVQFRGGSSAEHSSFTGAAREVTVDTTKNTLVVHDGSTPGGHPVARAYAPSFDGDTVVETGSLNVYQSANSGSTSVWNGGWSSGGRNITSSIFSDGSATFAGSLEVGNPDDNVYRAGFICREGDGAGSNGGYSQFYCKNGQANTPVSLYNGDQSKEIVSFFDDGSATFAGDITSSLNTFDTSNAASVGARVSPGGVVLVKRGAADTSKVFQGFGGTAETSTIKADGSATFANTVTSGSSDFTGPYSYISAQGVGVMANADTPKAAILADGSATFANTVQSSFFDCKSDRTGTQNISRWDSGEGAEVAVIFADGSAQFAGAVTADGGVILKSPNGTAYKLSVANDGTLSATAV